MHPPRKNTSFWRKSTTTFLASVGAASAGVIHQWDFDETSGTTLADSVGSADGSVIVQAGGGGYALAGGGLTLDGGDRGTADYVQFPGSVFDGLTDVSFEIWIEPITFQNWGRVFCVGPGDGQGLADGQNLLRAALCRATDQNTQKVGLWGGGVETNLPTSASTLYHHVVTWDADGGAGGNGLLAIYRDGALLGTQDTGATTITTLHAFNTNTAFWLGRTHFGGDSTANATWHQVRVYDEVLDDTMVSNLHGAGLDGSLVPTANDDGITLNAGAKANLTVLANDTGILLDPASVQVIVAPTAGTAQVLPNGSILYTHDGGATGDSFTYTVDDSLGNPSNEGTVTITLDNALRLPNTTVTIPAETPPSTYQIVDAFPGLVFDDVLAIRTPQGVTDQVYLAERRGIISFVPDIHAETPTRQVLLDLTGTGQVSFDDTNEGELGLLGFDFHPDYLTNGYVYLFYTAPGGSPFFDRVSRFTVTSPGGATPTVNLASEQILIDQIDQVFNHNAGDVHFGPDGFLYISMGDEGDQLNGRQNAQRIDKDLFSAILRIDVDRSTGLEPNAHPAIPTYPEYGNEAAFTIPTDNPFVLPADGGSWDGSFNGSIIGDPSLVRTEFFAVGMRSPWRMSFDSLTGELWVGDVGQYDWEEVHVLENGDNGGWAYREGFQVTPGSAGNPNIGTPPAGFSYVEPVWDYPHGGGNFQGNSVTGGVVYRGSEIPELTGKYIFGDFRSGNIWSLQRNPSAPATVERLGGDAGIAGFGLDPSNGDVLLADYTENKVKRLVKTTTLASNFPTRLSETGIFADLTTLEPNPGILAYDPKVAFWSDHAIKSRWFTIPDTSDHMTFATTGNWDLPTGSLWVKHFDLELERGNPSTKKRIETRVLVRTDDGSFGVSYQWDDSGSEAYLVDEGGELFDIAINEYGTTVMQTYEIPSRATCINCHTPVGGHALSFNTRQLNFDGALGGVAGNQIATLAAAGYFDGPIPSLDYAPVFAAADDTGYSLEYRVRSYLAVNCVQCHQPGGPAPSTWNARADVSLEETGLINGTADRPADGDDFLIVPGDPHNSILLQRIKAGNGYTRMPLFGSHVLDDTAISLVTEWITTALPGYQTYAQWADSTFGPGAGAIADADFDADGDGILNRFERLAHTDPLDSTDYWRIELSQDGDDVVLNLDALANAGVIVEGSSNMQTWHRWEIPGNPLLFPATGGPLQIMQDRAELGGKYYLRARFIEP